MSSGYSFLQFLQDHYSESILHVMSKVYVKVVNCLALLSSGEAINNSVTISYSAKEITEYWNKKSSNIYYLQKHMVTKQKLWGGGTYRILHMSPNMSRI